MRVQIKNWVQGALHGLVVKHNRIQKAIVKRAKESVERKQPIEAEYIWEKGEILQTKFNARKPKTC